MSFMFLMDEEVPVGQVFGWLFLLCGVLAMLYCLVGVLQAFVGIVQGQ